MKPLAIATSDFIHAATGRGAGVLKARYKASTMTIEAPATKAPPNRTPCQTPSTAPMTTDRFMLLPSGAIQQHAARSSIVRSSGTYAAVVSAPTSEPGITTTVKMPTAVRAVATGTLAALLINAYARPTFTQLTDA